MLMSETLVGGETPLFTRSNSTGNYIKVLTSSQSSLALKAGFVIL